ncbi:hypothetical protein [Halomonas getboli]|uniref:hypothetical protein n=1 Tax=Halomonas getboli TaxID=2935862 RepID=UPI001FFE9D95|nr:hypothetical protein [Halomonas getboli]MCK2182840.1 hypothetical protein [Halomonas getboli]
MSIALMGLMLAGCSYTPARFHATPLIEIVDHPVGHSRHQGQNDQGEDGNAQ